MLCMTVCQVFNMWKIIVVKDQMKSENVIKGKRLIVIITKIILNNHAIVYYVINFNYQWTQEIELENFGERVAF